MLAVRPEAAGDRARVHALQTAAFGRSAEADLVDALRTSAHPRLSLVAERAGCVIGHVFFSPVSIEGAAAAPACAGLAPLAVWPDAQGEGVGGALVRAGIARCAEVGWRAVFLVGDPAYYGRFGFELAGPRGLHYQSEAFDAAFQLLEVAPGALRGCTGWVRYLARLALALPGAEQGTSYGTPAWKVGGKLFARLLPDAADVAVKVGFDDRDFLMKANPRAFHITDHYTNYEMMLVRLSAVDAEELRVLLEGSWLRSAPKRLVSALGAEE